MEITSFYETHEPAIHSHYTNIKKILDGLSVSDPEGNCFYYHKTTTEFKELICKRANILYHAKDCKRLCEIGLNAGHSAVLIQLVAAPDAFLQYFDLGEHKYARPAFEYLKTNFPQSIDIVFGDSKITMPAFIKECPETVESFDFVHVDGGHEYECFSSDIQQAMQLCKKGGIIVIDDTQISYIYDWIRAAEMANLIEVLEMQLPTVGYMHTVVKKK